MPVDELQDETRVALREAEELLDALPPLSPDHETVRMIVVQLRQSLRNARDYSDMTRRALTESRNTLENSRKLVADVGKRAHARQRPSARAAAAQAGGQSRAPTRRSNGGAITVFLDLDTVLLDTHPGKYGPELSVQGDIRTALRRLSEVADKVVVIANPKPADGGHVMDTNHRLEVFRAGLSDQADGLLIATCTHGENGDCDCAKPGHGLISTTLKENGFDSYSAWYIGGDQAGIVAGRTAGLSTVRIGPVGNDHLSEVHKPDHAARDLMDAANRILLETLAAD
jgi:D-glycero-D-manno-heptose 1,7-bisphosphate phosphatase